jgi:hypothetical protein
MPLYSTPIGMRPSRPGRGVLEPRLVRPWGDRKASLRRTHTHFNCTSPLVTGLSPTYPAYVHTQGPPMWCVHTPSLAARAPREHVGERQMSLGPNLMRAFATKQKARQASLTWYWPVHRVMHTPPRLQGLAPSSSLCPRSYPLRYATSPYGEVR